MYVEQRGMECKKRSPCESKALVDCRSRQQEVNDALLERHVVLPGVVASARMGSQVTWPGAGGHANEVFAEKEQAF